PLLPSIRVAPLRRPFDGRRQVADDRVEPDIDLLVRVFLPARQGNGDAPIEVARYGSRLEVANELEGVLAHVRTPVVMALDPRLQLVTKRRQVEEEVLGFLELDGRVAAALVRIDQVDRVELVAAVLALVASRRV